MRCELTVVICTNGDKDDGFYLSGGDGDKEAWLLGLGLGCATVRHLRQEMQLRTELQSLGVLPARHPVWNVVEKDLAHHFRYKALFVREEQKRKEALGNNTIRTCDRSKNKK